MVTTTMVSAFEIDAYAASALRGDVFPACIRLTQTRSEEQWLDRLAIVLSVGPACPRDVLDRACKLMPLATEPLLLRAAASLRRAAMARNELQRTAHEDAACADLEKALALDPFEATARVLHPAHGVARARTSFAASARL